MHEPTETNRERTNATRRRVLGTVVGVTGLSGPTGAVTDAAATPAETDATDDFVPRADRPNRPGRLPLVDAHTHIVPEAVWDRDPLDAEQLVEWMDENGVDRAVVLPLESPEAYPVPAPTWWVLEETAQYPERLLPFCSIDPRTIAYEDAVEDRLERYVADGARGFGELKPGLAVDDPKLRAIYELCAEYELPVLFHADDKAMLDDPAFSRFEAIVASYPDVDFLGHGQGWWARISGDVDDDDLGGYPEGAIEPGGPVPELLSTYDNVYGELSGNSGWNALSRDPEYGQQFLESHHEQLLFGTDYLYPGYDVPNFRLFETFELDRSAWSDIRYENLLDLLR